MKIILLLIAFSILATECFVILKEGNTDAGGFVQCCGITPAVKTLKLRHGEDHREDRCKCNCGPDEGDGPHGHDFVVVYEHGDHSGENGCNCRKECSGKDNERRGGDGPHGQ
ncbi:hypothetical protein CRE_05054 [Caenorhabditis remanei]|uniref:Uncharacterized protein n=1 Tax=Caenorhabditis remanei TaxID=31234 RepID=E3MYZ3_CAERE|nr:hypothetical protein CRE_05054 [Caenorhabditis remanei]